MLPNNGYIEVKVDGKPIRVEWYRSNPAGANAQFNVFVGETMYEIVKRRRVRRFIIHDYLFDRTEKQARECLLQWQSKAKV